MITFTLYAGHIARNVRAVVEKNRIDGDAVVVTVDDVTTRFPVRSDFVLDAGSVRRILETAANGGPVS